MDGESWHDRWIHASPNYRLNSAIVVGPGLTELLTDDAQSLVVRVRA